MRMMILAAKPQKAINTRALNLMVEHQKTSGTLHTHINAVTIITSTKHLSHSAEDTFNSQKNGAFAPFFSLVGVDEAICKGVYLITANNPDEVLALLNAKGYHK